MRFLVDQPVSPLLAKWLRDEGHDAQHVRDRGMSCASDEDIFSVASAEDAVIVTSDLDYSRILALSRRDRPGLILFRAGPMTDQDMLLLLQRVMVSVPLSDIRRSIVIADRARLRIAALPVRPDMRHSES